MLTIPADVFADRLAAARTRVADAGLDALLLTPGPDLTYLSGYAALPLERLTCLVVPAAGDPFLIAPRLEVPSAQSSPIGANGVDIIGCGELDDPYTRLLDRVPTLRRAGARIAVDNHMWAERVLHLRELLPAANQSLAAAVTAPMRAVKAPIEIACLHEAGAAIDRVHARIGEWLRPGRTEAEVGRDIADAIIAEGHVRVDFVIVGSGPNGASPHHELSDRVIQPNEPIVIDIGGTTAAGYCSDSTRMYAVGQPEDDFLRYFEVLHAAQRAGRDAVRPGVPAEAIDAACRDIITEAGYGEWFIHRTGHGIGLETHEEPYMVAGNRTPLVPGMAFSVEPGIYLPGRHGARIEDCVAVTADGVESFNHSTRDLVVL